MLNYKVNVLIIRVSSKKYNYPSYSERTLKITRKNIENIAVTNL
jgi:hypothetical protein